MTGTVTNRPPATTFGWLGLNGAAELPASGEPLALRLGEGESRTLVLRRAANVTAELAPNAVLRLVQLRRGGAETQANRLRVRCAENARFEWYRVALGGAATCDDCAVELSGAGSSFAAELGFRLKGMETLDVNCHAVHTGKNTDSVIRASGALSGTAQKLLRCAIDFRRGCAGATGRETEDVLLLDEGVRNRSLPVILCAEEDVSGEHGATAGQPDETLLYYLEARGLDRAAARELMAAAKLNAVLRRLPDEALRRELLGEEDEP